MQYVAVPPDVQQLEFKCFFSIPEEVRNRLCKEVERGIKAGFHQKKATKENFLQFSCDGTHCHPNGYIEKITFNGFVWIEDEFFARVCFPYGVYGQITVGIITGKVS